MLLDYDGNRVFEVRDNGEWFTYIAKDKAAALDAHAAAIAQLLQCCPGWQWSDSAIESEPVAVEVMPSKEIAIRFDNLKDALQHLGPRVIEVPPFVGETGSIVLKMPACSWAKTKDIGVTEQIGSSVF